MPELGVNGIPGIALNGPTTSGTVGEGVLPILSTTNLDGNWFGGFGDLFYNRVYIDPIQVDLGKILLPQDISVLVWNGYADQSKLMEAMNIIGGEGIAVSGETLPPNELPPLGMMEFVIHVSMDGPVLIDCGVNLVFGGDGGDDKQIILTGSRLAFWCWPLPFLRGGKETLAWLTDVLCGTSGVEQRVGLREAPRQIYEISSRVPRGFESAMDNLLYGWRHRTWGVPVWMESTPITAPAAKGDTRIMADTRYADYRIGGLCVVYGAHDRHSTGTIIALSETHIDIEEPLPGEYGPGTWVMPMREAVMTADPSMERTDGGLSLIKARFFVQDTVALQSAIPEPKYNDLEVTVTPVVLGNRGRLSDVFERETAIIDFETGIRKQASGWSRTRPTRSYTLVLRSREAIWGFRLWLHRRAGKLVPFYQPSFQKDMVMVNLEGEVGNVLICRGQFHPTMGAARIHIAFFINDGTVVFGEITNLTANTDGTMTLVLDQDINIPRTNVTCISYMGVKRLAADSVTITWNRFDLAEVDYSITEIRP